MKTKDILMTPVTLLASASGYNGKGEYVQRDVPLGAVLELGRQWKDNIRQLREMDDLDEQKKCKLKFPCWTAGGTFPQKQLFDNAITSYSNLMVIDIDAHDNPDIDLNEIKQYLFDYEFTVLVSKSIRGNGLYALIAIGDGFFTKEYYQAMVGFLERQYGVRVDSVCGNIARKRFISYDDEILIKGDEVDIVPLQGKFNRQEKTAYKPKGGALGYSDEFTCCAISLLIEKYGYKANTEPEWFMDGIRLATFGEWGRKLFIELSRRSDKYRSDREVNSKFDSCVKRTRFDKSCLSYYFGRLKAIIGPDWIQAVKQYGSI